MQLGQALALALACLRSVKLVQSDFALPAEKVRHCSRRPELPVALLASFVSVLHQDEERAISGGGAACVLRGDPGMEVD